MTTRIGYVGLDHHHRDPYLATIERLDARVVASADPDGNRPTDVGAEPLADRPWYEDPAAMMDSESLDLVWVTLSNRVAPAVIQGAVEAGLDVLSEKPGARTGADLEPVAATVSESDATVGFAYTWRAHPVAEEIADRASEGFFGDLSSFDAQFVASAVSTRPTDHYLFDAEASRGGILQWLGVHWIDLLPWLLDDRIARVNATTTSSSDEIDVEDGATAQIELESGAVGTLRAGYYLREGRYDTSIDIYGDRGRCSWDPMGERFGFDEETSVTFDSVDWPSAPRREITYEYQPAPGYGGRWGQSFFEQFFAARRGEAPNPAPIEDTIEVLRVLDALYESAERGAWVATR